MCVFCSLVTFDKRVLDNNRVIGGQVHKLIIIIVILKRFETNYTEFYEMFKIQYFFSVIVNWIRDSSDDIDGTRCEDDKKAKGAFQQHS